jgi:hypothetical protein
MDKEISYLPFTDPVQLSCEHTYDQHLIDQLKECPNCRAEIKKFFPVNSLISGVGEVIDSISSDTLAGSEMLKDILSDFPQFLSDVKDKIGHPILYSSNNLRNNTNTYIPQEDIHNSVILQHAEEERH